jgi:hypothetical protein
VKAAAGEVALLRTMLPSLSILLTPFIRSLILDYFRSCELTADVQPLLSIRLIMSLHHQLLQVTSLFLDAVKNNQLDAFQSSFLALTSRLSATVNDGSASKEDILLGEEVGSAVEVLATCFANVEQSEQSNLAAVRESVAKGLSSSSASVRHDMSDLLSLMFSHR